ncbi:MAG TPA: DUF6658 family protein [Leptolyngbyaceae cyanobacterium]
MKQLTSFFKKVKIHQLLTALVAVIALFVTTACNAGDQMGARPMNPPVQAGGANNPYKGGGDSYTKYNLSTDPNAHSTKGNSNRDRADLQLISGQLIAANQIESDAADLLYPGSDATHSANPDIGPRGEKELTKSATQIPAPRQDVIDRSNPGEQILEKAGQAFKDASNFLKDDANEASKRPELQPNPGRR